MKRGMATLNKEEKTLSQQNQQGKIIAINCPIQNLQRGIDRADQRAQRSCPVYDPNNELWIEVKELETQIIVLDKQLDVLMNDTETANMEGGIDMLDKYVTIDCDSTPKRSQWSSDFSELNNTSSRNI
jgi:hypothetical protein